jgi:hypothetical protein
LVLPPEPVPLKEHVPITPPSTKYTKTVPLASTDGDVVDKFASHQKVSALAWVNGNIIAATSAIILDTNPMIASS